MTRVEVFYPSLLGGEGYFRDNEKPYMGKLSLEIVQKRKPPPKRGLKCGKITSLW
jgi:hypothetical protein